MASPIEAQLILCDAAQAEPTTGKIHMLGAGWSTMTGPAPHAVAVLIKVPWDRANQPLQLSLRLLTADGHPVLVSGPAGAAQEVHAAGTVEVGRPAGVLHGSPLDACFALNVGPLPLLSGRYEWKLRIAEFESSASFLVSPPAQAPQGA